VTIPCIVQVRAKLPAFFTRDVGAFIGGYVILQDPNNNHIQVAIEKKKQNISKSWLDSAQGILWSWSWWLVNCFIYEPFSLPHKSEKGNWC
jgi:hypothetical protein